MLKPGAVVVDVGINVVDGKLVGDVDFASASLVASAITPVPGGVGPLTNAILLTHLVRAARDQANGPRPAGRALPRRCHAGGPLMSFPSDLEIARSVTPRPIADIAHELGYRDDEIELYGSTQGEDHPRGHPPPGGGAPARQVRPGDGHHPHAPRRGQEHHDGRPRPGPRADRQEGRGRPPPAQPRPGLRHQGRRRGRRLQPGHPDGGLQPPPHGRRPRDRRRAQPRRGVHRQPHPPRQRSSASTPTASSGRACSTSATAPCGRSWWAWAARTTATRARASS